MRLGADPEIFAVNPQTGKYISVLGKIGGTKDKPIPVPELGNGFTLQEDNVAVELGIPPAASATEYYEHLKKCMDAALDRLKGLSFSMESAAIFDSDELQHPGAFVFGCEPDFNAWSGDTNPSPCADNPNLRSAGGHVHVETNLDKRAVIKAMDFMLGVPSVIMDEGHLRKTLYGKMGAYRPKPYGVEYRTLSNFWVFDKRYVQWVWDNTQRALEMVENGLSIDHLGQRMHEAINKNNKDVAKQLIDEYKLEVV